MQNQEQYALIWEKARKYDKLVEIIDKIKAEIQIKIKEENYGVISDHTHEDGLEEALEIIDKYWEVKNE